MVSTLGLGAGVECFVFFFLHLAPYKNNKSYPLYRKDKEQKNVSIRNYIKGKKIRMCLAKRRHKDHTYWPGNSNAIDRNYTNCLGILTNIMLRTQLNIMIKKKKKSRKHWQVPGRLYWLYAPSRKPLFLTMKKHQIPWLPLGVQPGTELAAQAPWNLPSILHLLDTISTKNQS